MTNDWYDIKFLESAINVRNGFVAGLALKGDNQSTVPASDILVPLSGGYVGSAPTYAMQPINNVKLNEYALQFLGTFLLSSLVRYRPQIWQNAISRSVTVQGAADDREISRRYAERIPRHGGACHRLPAQMVASNGISLVL